MREASIVPSPVPYFSGERIADGTWMIRNAFVAETPALCYLIEGEDQALLIDSIIGLGNLKAYCESLTDKPITLVNTHAHIDHVSSNYHFSACWMHHRDIPLFQDGLTVTREQFFEYAKKNALPEYRPLVTLDDNFRSAAPMRVYPLYDGDVFDLGGRTVEVVEVGGHTPGSIVLIDRKTRIAFTGDACNGNTLLEFDHSLPVADYLQSLMRLKRRQKDFDMAYGGHEIFSASIVDEAIETVARVVAGTDDKCQRIGMEGKPVLYAAEKVRDGYERADGKHFNMSYRPDKIAASETKCRVIKNA